MTRFYKYDIIYSKFVIYKNIWCDNTRTVDLKRFYRACFNRSNIADLVFPFKSMVWSYFEFYKEFYKYFLHDYNNYKCDLFNVDFKKNELRNLAAIANGIYLANHPKYNWNFDFTDFDHFMLDLIPLEMELHHLSSLHPFRLKLRVGPSTAAPMKW